MADTEMYAMAMADHDLGDDESHGAAIRVREELARHRLSRDALASRAGISLSTLEKALSGRRRFSLETLVRLEKALQVPLRQPAAAPPSDTAPASMGAYARLAVDWVEGRYLAVRPSFGTPGALFAYLITIGWQADAQCLGFAESNRIDARFEQAGHVSMPNLSGHIYLVTNMAGQHRLIVLGRPTIEGILHGVLTTLEIGRGAQLVPSACAFAMRKLAGDESPTLGLVAPGAAAHEGYHAMVRRTTEEDFVRFHAL